MNIVDYVLERSPQALNVLSLKIKVAELYIEFRLKDNNNIEMGCLIKKPTGLIIESTILNGGGAINSQVFQTIESLNAKYNIEIKKIFITDENLFESLVLEKDENVGSEDQSSIPLYLVKEHQTSLGYGVLSQLFSENPIHQIGSYQLNCNLGFEMGDCLEQKKVALKSDISDVVSEDVFDAIYAHVKLCSILFELRQNCQTVKLNLMIGLTKTREDIFLKQEPLIINLSLINYILCKYSRNAVELRTKKDSNRTHYHVGMNRIDLFELVKKYNKPFITTSYFDRNIIYAEYLGKKVFYLVEKEVMNHVYWANQALLANLSENLSNWLMENVFGELCQRYAQKTIFHTVTVNDCSIDRATLEHETLKWMRGKGYKYNKVSLGQMSSFISSNAMISMGVA